jgi:hypothetical protein
MMMMHKKFREELVAFFPFTLIWTDRLCGLLVSVPGYRSRGPGFDSRRYQIFWEVVEPTQPHEYNWGATWKKQ